MLLDSKYVIAPSLEMYFVDKTTGLPLAGGIVNFWSDTNRANPKSAYTLSGSPPNYSYVPLPTTITLSAVGTFQDAGQNNIIPYWYPYDSDGNIELYFLEIFSADGTPQFTREAWPNIIAQSENALADITNYVPNGQFLMHNNIAENVINNTPEGRISQPITQIAQGGWTFERPTGSTATDDVTFFEFGSYVTNPTASPRFACQVTCESANPSDAYKYLAIKWGDVNKFSSDSNEFTFAFNGVTVDSGNFNVNLYLIKNFGTGGAPSSTTTRQLTTFNITDSNQLFQYAFTFGDNLGQEIGDNNDDYVQLAIGFPTSISFSGQFTDYMLLNGNVTVSEFPTQTNADMIARTMVPNVPDYYGYNFYLPRVMTPQGEIYDDSSVGTIIISSSNTPPLCGMLCDGATSYQTAGYDSNGVPYRRVYNKIISVDNSGVGVWGTGPQFVYCAQNATSYFILNTNQKGAQTNTVDVNTGFTITNCFNGQTDSYGFFATPYGVTGAPTIWLQNEAVGAVTGTLSSGSAAFSFNRIPDYTIGETIGNPQVSQRISIQVNSLPATSDYIQIATPSTQYYLWFQINGAGTDPAPGGTGIMMNIPTVLNSGINLFASLVSNCLTGNQGAVIQCVAGSSITANSYWEFHANGQLYYAWYSLNDMGNDPMVSNGIGISISYTTGDSANTVCLNTIKAINGAYFCTPDLRGKYMQFGPINSTNRELRYTSTIDQLSGWFNYQFDTVPGHAHYIITNETGSGVSSFHNITTTSITNNTPVYTLSLGSANTLNPSVSFEGVGQNDVPNASFLAYLRY